ncbi:flagellar basal-body MS-ring/collar protein FliF (plasmid) [Rossellomorea sp. AcN35-11]|nr:flagellar M-ring protein FliF [Rossellomorea aquimaris]WJV32279.1 flagellar basal-body MS-ring/collar protein FliF [Rossellomorea sp. AcN35-11]
MNDKIQSIKNRAIEFWKNSTNKQKIIFIGVFLLITIAGSAVSVFSTQSTLVPLYSNLTPQETGQIKEQLDGRGIKSQISNGGSSILVPAENVENLTVELAAQGIPQSSDVDYSFFSENAGFGMTDNEFGIMKVDAMQTELANLIKGIDGVKNAKVMLTLPEKSIWMNSNTEQASASVVIEQEYGYQIEQKQIKGLYNLISRSVPNLPIDNIVIMNQLFETFSYSDDKSSDFANVGNQLAIKKQIEEDLQKQVQSMLGTVMGPNKVRVMVTTDIDFTQETSEVNKVEPVDIEKNEGLALSVERITETFTGNGAGERVPGTADEDITGNGGTYSEANTQNGDYSRTEERINNEVNRIRKSIVEAPYKISDLGLQVVVEPPVADDIESLTPERKEDIENLLNTIVRTTIQQEEPLTEEELNEKIFVSVQPFNGKFEFDENGINGNKIPVWIYAVGAIFLIAVIGVLIMIMKRKRKGNDTTSFDGTESKYTEPGEQAEDIVFSEDPVVNQLSKMSKEKPQDVVKLLRTWMNEDR